MITLFIIFWTVFGLALSFHPDCAFNPTGSRGSSRTWPQYIKAMLIIGPIGWLALMIGLVELLRLFFRFPFNKIYYWLKYLTGTKF